MHMTGAWALMLLLTEGETSAAPDEGRRDHLERTFERHPDLADDDIRISASGMLLTLTGSVDSAEDRTKALTLARAWALPRRMIVEDQLRVRSDGDSADRTTTARERLEAQLRRKLENVPGIDRVRVQVVQVPRLRVVLRGDVDSERTRREVLEIVRAAPAAEELQDELTVGGRPR
jgi:osmotically-inducible protein OsmY